MKAMMFDINNAHTDRDGTLVGATEIVNVDGLVPGDGLVMIGGEPWLVSDVMLFELDNGSFVLGVEGNQPGGPSLWLIIEERELQAA